jgi:hypothetical protein
MISHAEYLAGMGRAPIQPSPTSRRLILVPIQPSYRDGSFNTAPARPSFDNSMPVTTVGSWTPWGGSRFPAPGGAMENF